MFEEVNPKETTVSDKGSILRADLEARFANTLTLRLMCQKC